MALTKITPQMFDTSAAGHDFNIDNGTFFVDASANRVGIGTTTPSTLLDVNGVLTATSIAGTLTTAAQTNITSVGTLSSLTVSGALNGTLSTAAQTNITSLGTLTALTVDDITIDGSTISDAGEFTLDIGGDINIDADGGDINFKDGGTLFGQISNASGLYLVSNVSDAHMYFRGNDGGNFINALTLDMSSAGTAIFNSNISGGGHLNLPDNGAVRLGAANDLEIYHDGSNTYIDNKTSGPELLLRDANAIILRKYGTSDNMIHCAGGGAVNLYHNGSLKLQTSSTGAIVTGKLTSDNLHVEYASNVSVANLAEVDDYAPVRFGDFRADQSDNLYIMSVGGGKIGMQARDDSASGATRTLSLNPFGGNVGIGETSFSNYLAPDLVVVASAQNGGITVKSSSTSHAGTLAFADATSGTDTYDGYVQYEHNNRALTLATAATERVRINSTGLIIIDTSLVFDKPSVYGFRFLHNDNGNDLSLQIGDANNANYRTLANFDTNGININHLNQDSNMARLRLGRNVQNDSYVYFNTIAQDWSIGVDYSDSSKFKLSRYSSPGNGNNIFEIGTAGDMAFHVHLTPATTNTYDLGTSTVRWRNIFSQDLHLSNEDTGGNDVDGTEGNWTIQEGEEHLYIINNKTGKKFRFALEEVT